MDYPDVTEILACEETGCTKTVVDGRDWCEDHAPTCDVVSCGRVVRDGEDWCLKHLNEVRAKTGEATRWVVDLSVEQYAWYETYRKEGVDRP